jgi:septum formation protein
VLLRAQEQRGRLLLSISRPLIVATASPNRRAILADAGLKFETAVPQADESVRDDETPEQYVKRLALAKAHSISGFDPDSLVLSADTCIDIEGEILGKPRDESHAREMLKRLSGKWHEVWGGIALRDDKTGKIDVRGLCTKVKFSKLSDKMIDWYIATGEPMERAGSYAIQGKGRTLVESVDGCFTNVIGISIPTVFEMLLAAAKD